MTGADALFLNMFVSFRGFYLKGRPGSLPCSRMIYSRSILMLLYFLPMCRLFSFRQLHQTSVW